MEDNEKEELFQALQKDDIESVRNIVNMKNDPDLKLNLPEKEEIFHYQPPLLSIACYFKSFQSIDFLIASGADFNLKDSKGRPPILFAILSRSLFLIERMINIGFTLDVTDDLGDSPLHYAVLQKDLQLINYLGLIAAVPLSPENLKKETPLHYAVRLGCIDIVEFLCESGADVNHQNINLATPLHYSCSSRGCFEIVKMLTEFGANISLKDNGGLQPYHWTESEEVQNYLIEHGARVRDY